MSHNATHSTSGFLRNEARSFQPILLPPISATLTLSEGATFGMEPDNVSSRRTDPAANTEAVFMKFLRVDAIIMNFLMRSAS
jgi:hypothetical protein